MEPDKIAEILSQSVNSALEKIGAGNQQPQQQQQNADMQQMVTAVSGLSKVVDAVSKKVEALDKTAVKNVPEPVEETVGKLAKTVEAVANKVEKIAKGEKIDEEDIDFSKPMKKKDFAKMLKKMITDKDEEDDEEKPAPKGKGKDDLKELLKTIAKGKNDEEIEIDAGEIDIEDKDVAGNELSKKQKKDRAALDKHLGGMLNSSAAAHGFAEDAEDSDDDDE
jgi:hypothetical protein